MNMGPSKVLYMPTHRSKVISNIYLFFNFIIRILQTSTGEMKGKIHKLVEAGLLQFQKWFVFNKIVKWHSRIVWLIICTGIYWMPKETTHFCFSISSVIVFWVLEYTVHSCQIDLTQHMSNILTGRRDAIFASHSRILKTGL